MKVGEYWEKNTLGLLDFEGFDSFYLYDINSERAIIVPFGAIDHLIEVGWPRGAYCISIKDLLKYYSKTKDREFKTIKVLDMGGAFVAPRSSEGWVCIKEIE